MSPLIFGDIARCPGDGHPNCTDCLRRLQIEIDKLDTSGRPYSFFMERGEGCVSRITEAGNDKP